VGRVRRQTRPAAFLIATTSFTSTIGNLESAGEDSKNDGASYNRVVEVDELEKILGLSRHDGEDREREPRRGVVWGLVVTGMGEGAIMPVESIATPGRGYLKLTGSLGDVCPELIHSYYPGLIHRVF
jgi:ATP-dependent Lon protease